nr:MAG TPA: hypothetical protein [Caudoviricetes sp.]
MTNIGLITNRGIVKSGISFLFTKLHILRREKENKFI